MTIAKTAYSAAFFVLGFGVGALWSPRGGALQMPPDSHAISDLQSEHEKNEKYVAEMLKTYNGKTVGDEITEFVRQFKDMTIRIKKNPIDAWASPDGRFVIRLFGSDETIASDLFCPATGRTVKELVRHYAFSNGDQTYLCDFGRSIENSKMTSILFDAGVKGKTKYVYFDSDGDGLWDRFTDLTQEPPKTYVREGVGWKWKEIEREKRH